MCPIHCAAFFKTIKCSSIYIFIVLTLSIEREHCKMKYNKFSF